MGTKITFKDQHPPHHYSYLTKKLLRFVLYALVPLVLFLFYVYPVPLTDQVPQIQVTTEHEQQSFKEIPCDYSNGRWVRDRLGPLYNGTTCRTIKEGQNCINHGRPDMDYLYWKWKPKHCNLPRFQASTFLNLIKNKHLAFIGDSMARNQLESLLCLLSTVSSPKLFYRDSEENKFRKWHFASHNTTISVYWSPFLVKGIEKSNTGVDHNNLYLDSVDDRWAKEMDQMDMVVLSVGHWFLHPAVYYERDEVLGCHYCPGLNHTEIGFYDVFRKAMRTTLEAIMERRKGLIDVIVTTFSPSHFEGEWDKAGACPKKRPFKEGEKEVEGMDEEMRRIEVEEVEVVKEKIMAQLLRLRVEVLDITKLSIMRPDGHPGPYMYPFPLANGVAERVQNDCVHWCLPGPVDAWNGIMLEVMKRWENQSSREA